jgi:hypothetical protein
VLLRSGGLPIPHHSFHRQAGDLPAARALLDLDLLTGACLAVRRSAFEAAGGFDESYRNGWEDMDLCLKLRANGGRVTYRGDIELVHHEGKTRGDVHGTDDNAQLFYGRWLAQVDDDGDLLARAFDSVQQPDAPVAERELPAGAVVVGGHASGPSPGADEARALLAALEAAGLAPALAEPAMPFVRASLAQDELDVLDRAARRALTREALLVEVVDGRRLAPASQGVARLATLPAAGLGAAQSVWASSPAAVDEIVAAGMHPERVALLPPPIDGVELGPGGDGLLVALPAHDRALVEALLEAIAPLVAAVAVRLVPNVRPDWLEARVAERLPAATLLPTCASERRFAELAATADAVVCCDPDEPHGRRALVAAAAGAVPVALGSAPAGYVLGDRAVAVEEPTSAALRAAAEHALSIAGERGALAAAVDGECGIATTGARLRELVSAAQMARGAAAPRGAGVR